MEYTLRKPKATDLFVVGKIIRGIGLKDIAECFNAEDIKSLKAQSTDGNFTDEQLIKTGVEIVTKVGDLVLEKIDLVQNDLIKFISNLTGLKVKQVEDLPITDFAEVTMAIIKEPDFVDFIKVVLKSFK